ncbi:MAG: hypothetical protein ABJO09_06275 [Hyphomicrobiales bacterium]
MTQQKPGLRKAQMEDAPALTACIDATYARYVESISNLPAVSEEVAEEILAN